MPQVINHPVLGPILNPWGDNGVDPNEQAIAEQRAQAEAKAAQDAADRAEVQADLDAQFAQPAVSTDGVTGGFAGRQSTNGLVGAPVPDAPAIQPDVTTGASPTSGSNTTRTSTSESGSVSQSGPVDVGQPVMAADPQSGQVIDAVSGAGQLGGDPYARATPPQPEPAQPSPSDPGTTTADGLVDPFGVSPEAQQAAAEQRSVDDANALDAREARLKSMWDNELIASDNHPEWTAQDKLDSQNRLTIIQARLGDITAQRGAEAAAATAAAQAKIKAEDEERQRIAERDAAIKQKAIDSDHKWRMDKLDAADEEAAKKPIDRSWGNGSTGSLVMTAISVALAGLGSAMKGDGAHNPALDIVMQQIDQRVADQYKARGEAAGRREKQRGRLDVYQNEQTLSVKHQQDAMRAHLLKETADRLDQVGASLPASKKAAASAASQAMREKAMVIRKGIDHESYLIAAKNVDQEEKERHQREMEKNAQRQVGLGYSRLKLDRDQFNENKTRYYSPEVADERKLDREKKRAEIDKLKAEAKNASDLKALDAQKKALDLAEAEDNRTMQAIRPTVVKDEKTGLPVIKDGKIVVSYGTFKQPDGVTPVHLKGDEGGRYKVGDTVAAYEASARAIDALIKEVDLHGWEPGIARTDAYKNMQAIYTATLLEGKDVYGLGALQPAEIKIMGNLFGGDPTALVGDPTVSLRAARELLGQKAFTRFKAHSTYNGSYDDFKMPEDTNQGIRAAIQNTPADDLVQRAEGRVGSGVSDANNKFLTENWDPSLGKDQKGMPRYMGDDPRGIPSRDAYDAIQGAADLATGRIPGDPEDGKAALKTIIQTENHGPAWRLAARMAYENNIDLGIDYFNAQTYATAQGMPVEVQRLVYGTDPTYGYGGTDAGRAAHEKALGVTVTDADRQGYIDMLRKVR